jgi:hypothetical protein
MNKIKFTTKSIYVPLPVPKNKQRGRMKCFPESALVQLEYEKVKNLLALHCRTDYAKYKADNLRIHTKKEFIITELQQAYEFKLLLQATCISTMSSLITLLKN